MLFYWHAISLYGSFILFSKAIIMKRITIIASVLLLLAGVTQAQIDKQSELFKTLKSKDSLLFEVGFNTCELSVFDSLISEDIEFYHDKGGMSKSRQSFVNSIKNGPCSSGRSAMKRELIDSSLEVYPLHNNGVLYGAIQTGIHTFGDAQAKFTHLWMMDNGGWKLSRVLSYDHKSLSANVDRHAIYLPDEMLEQYAGKYEAAHIGLVTLEKTPEGLKVKAGNFEAILFPESEHVFFLKERDLQFEFLKNDKNEVEKFLVHQNDQVVDEAKKIQ